MQNSLELFFRSLTKRELPQFYEVRIISENNCDTHQK